MKPDTKENNFKIENVCAIADHISINYNYPTDSNNLQSDNNNIEINLNQTKYSSDETDNQTVNTPKKITQQFTFSDVSDNNNQPISKLNTVDMDNSNILIPSIRKDSTLSPAQSRRGRKSTINNIIAPEDVIKNKLDSYKHCQGMDGGIV